MMGSYASKHVRVCANWVLLVVHIFDIFGNH